MIVLGIDQGLANLGVAVLDYRSLEDFTVLHSGSIRTPAKNNLATRIGTIYQAVRTLLEAYPVDNMGCERFFFNASDKTLTFRSTTIVKTNMVTGVLFLLADEHKIPIKDFVPGTIKKHVTGDGRASKGMMVQAINTLCRTQGYDKDVKNDHEADAIGIALTVAHKAQQSKED